MPAHCFLHRHHRNVLFIADHQQRQLLRPLVRQSGIQQTLTLPPVLLILAGEVNEEDESIRGLYVVMPESSPVSGPRNVPYLHEGVLEADCFKVEAESGH
jgi:hypothetical protein